jgi:predicted metalloprotease with PDZ domain
MLGVKLAPLPARLRDKLGAPARGGVWIDGVTPDSPAAKAGFRRGDLLMRLGGKYVFTVAGALRRLSRHRPGDRVRVDLIRDRKWLTAKVRLARYRPAGQSPATPRAARARPGGSRARLLARLERLTAQVRALRRILRRVSRGCGKR